MKKIFFLLVLCWAIITKSNAYIPICFNGHLYSYKYDAGLGSNIQFYVKIECDTIIHNISYQQIKYCDLNGNNTSPLGAIREDTVAQKIYFLHSDSTQEYLAFDFSLQAGDSFLYINTYVKVDSVKTEFIQGLNRKVIYFENNYPTFIEGIGSSKFGHSNRPLALNYMMSTATLLSNSTVAANPCWTLQIENSIKLNAMNVYPNPAKNDITLEYLEPINEKGILEIYSNSGKLIARTQMHSNVKLKISVLNWNKGLYFYRLILKDNIFRNGKFIVE